MDVSLDAKWRGAMQSPELLGPLLQVERNILGASPSMQHRILSVATRCATEPCSAAPPRRGTGPLNQAATPKRRPIERHAQQYGRRPLSRAAAWWCVERTSRAASVEPLEEPVRAVKPTAAQAGVFIQRMVCVAGTTTIVVAQLRRTRSLHEKAAQSAV